MPLPTGIIFVNNDLAGNTQSTLEKQLFITQTLDGATFDGYVADDPDYPTFIRNNNMRVMVIRSFEELDNRELADVVIFVTYAMAAIEKNKFGPPGITYRVAELSWGKLCVYDLPIWKNNCGC